MSYKQWVDISIKPINFDMTIKNVTLHWGKFHAQSNKDIEIPLSRLEGKIIHANTIYDICSCGRDGASTGTQGSISLFDGKKWIAEYIWNNPWWPSASESLLVCDVSLDYFYRSQLYGIGEYERPIGSVIIDVIKHQDQKT
ncbi:Aegerolysin family protein [Sodalis praecaptivus]|uniref:Aegerolysin family protein n=1 Tax=Sodalis praecaptivus TaxID=1239307 RepID=W0HWY7_9GAMM|nr:aegerolysin family protein [Sodalis praecaptivus]AHF77012.1 Aegerolysin family protein [Sodalis praecaptivus]